MRSRRAGLVAIMSALLLQACGDEPPPAPLTPAAPAATAAAPTAEAPKLLSDQWYRTLEDDQTSGWRHVRWTRSSYEGKPTIHDRTEGFTSTTRQMGQESDTFEAREYSDIERTDDGLLYRAESRSVQGNRMEDSVQTWNGKGYDLTKHVAGLEEKHSVACDAPCPVDSEAFLSKKLQRGEVTVGQHFEYKSPNFEGNRVDTVTLDVKAREELTVPAGAFGCFRVVQSVVGMPGNVTVTWWLDANGVVRKFRTGRVQIVSCTESTARDLSEAGAVYSITMGTDPEMPRCTSLDRAVIEVTLAARDGVEMPDFPKTPFSHELSRTENAIRVELTSHDEAAESIALPVTGPQFAKHLERTNLFCWDAPRVKAALADAVGNEKDARLVVKKILRYVFVTLRKASGPIPEPTAVEILNDGGGDCSEHCVLFVTLCRAAGVPARRLSGYAQVGDMWGAHSFAEVWLGRWVGCDPTTNEFGTKARYLSFGWDDDADSYPGVVSSRASGRMTIRTLEFTEGGRTWKTEGLSNPSEREDVLSGLTFAEPPEGWNAAVSATGQGRVTGPGVRADVSVISGYGDLPCDVLSREMMRGSRKVKFAGRDALRDDSGSRGRATVQMMIPYKRRMLSVRVHVEDASSVESAMAVLSSLLAPTLSPAAQ